jgi:1-deoxy-D-xylulose-5-phosphate reductoisomerase
MKRISILGSTGSIGTSALDVIARHPDRFEVTGLAEGHDVAALAKQIERFRPRLVSVRDEASAKKLKELLKERSPEILWGIEGASKVASMKETDTVLSAIVGAAGLLPTIEAIKAKKTVALANKETMVIAGELVTKLAREMGVRILPVDSEHSAIYQSLEGHRVSDVSRIVLTASGGPFLNLPASEFEKVTVADALNHPRWSMGAKITVDSATMMNKGLEVIEARWLFDMPPEKIDVMIHPQSIVHSMVEYKDGCVIAQLGVPDMRAPIAYALSYPERVTTDVERLNLNKVGKLTFEQPDMQKFPALGLAYEALRAGRSAPVVLNAANEIAVAAFLDGRIGFVSIAGVVERTIEKHDTKHCDNIEMILEIDKQARETALAVIASVAKQSP